MNNNERLAKLANMALIGNISECKDRQEESYLEQWMLANNVKDDVSLFLSVIGPEAYRLLKNLSMPDKPSELSYGSLVKRYLAIISLN